MSKLTTFHFRIRTCLLIAALVAGMGGCVAPAQGGPVFVVTTRSPDDRVTVALVGSRAEVDVFSKTGIGSADVALTSGRRPSSLVLRFHLKGLEQMRFSYGATVVTVSVPSNRESPVLETIGLAGGEETISRGSPYWMSVEYVEAAKDPVGKGYFLVTAPQDFVTADPWAFSMSWVDFFR